MGSLASALGSPRLELVPPSEPQLPYAFGEDCICPVLVPPEGTFHRERSGASGGSGVLGKHLSSTAGGCWGPDSPPKSCTPWVCPSSAVSAITNLCYK